MTNRIADISELRNNSTKRRSPSTTTARQRGPLENNNKNELLPQYRQLTVKHTYIKQITQVQSRR